VSLPALVVNRKRSPPMRLVGADSPAWLPRTTLLPDPSKVPLPVHPVAVSPTRVNVPSWERWNVRIALPATTFVAA